MGESEAWFVVNGLGGWPKEGFPSPTRNSQVCSVQVANSQVIGVFACRDKRSLAGVVAGAIATSFHVERLSKQGI